jgi:AraC-like DNA-binding protein
MEANIGEPLTTEDIARLVGVSRRQLERLFRQHLDALPSRWYLELRLERARRLLQESAQSILQIGLSCGFSSAPHFPMPTAAASAARRATSAASGPRRGAAGPGRRRRRRRREGHAMIEPDR